MYFKKLSVDVKTDNSPLVDSNGGNFKFSNGKVSLVTYHWKDLFKLKILIKVNLSCKGY